jgi:hypothetical protein
MADDTSHPSPLATSPAYTPAPEPAKPGGIFSGSIAAKPAEKAPVTAADKLRAFEDKHLGKDCSRISGEIERGVGSPYAGMKPHLKAHHASLENLVKAEKAVADASADLEAAKAKHAAAVKTSDDASKAVETADKAA